MGYGLNSRVKQFGTAAAESVLGAPIARLPSFLVPFCVSGMLPLATLSLPLAFLFQSTHLSKPNSNATNFSGTFSWILFQVNHSLIFYV